MVCARLSGMIDVVCGFRSAISSALTVIGRPCESAKTSRSLGRLLEHDAREDGSVGPGDVPGDELRRDLLARRQDRFDQPSAVHACRQCREVRARPAAATVYLVATIAARPLGWKNTRSPAAASAGPSSLPSQARVEIGGRLGRHAGEFCRSAREPTSRG